MTSHHDKANPPPREINFPKLVARTHLTSAHPISRQATPVHATSLSGKLRLRNTSLNDPVVLARRSNGGAST